MRTPKIRGSNPSLLTFSVFLFQMAFCPIGSVCVGQTIFPSKDLAFAQVAASDSIDSVITITNRGTATYTGVLKFRMGESELWNPIVNGLQVLDGQMNISLSPDTTATFKITATSLQVGIAVFLANDSIQNNLIEGNLTYFIRSGSVITDSIGVPPSEEFYRASLPFEDFSTVALALANADFVDQLNATVTLRVRSSSGTQQGLINLTLPGLAHTAQFLSQMFPGVSLEGPGRVDIDSQVPVIGTAVTLVNNQISTLPLNPSPTLYTVRTVSPAGTSSGEATLWAEGPFVKGYLRLDTSDGVPLSSPEVNRITGELISGVLKLNFFAQGQAFEGQEVSMYVLYPNFSFDALVQTGNWVMTFLSDNSVRTGTLELTKKN